MDPSSTSDALSRDIPAPSSVLTKRSNAPWPAGPSGTGSGRPSRASSPVASGSRGCVDGGSFAEEALLANWDEEGLGADGVVTGMALVGGRRVALMANDPTVKAGLLGRPRQSRRSCASRSRR